VDLISKTQLEALTGRTYTTDEFDVINMVTTDTLRGEAGDRISDPPQPGIASLALTVAARVLVNASGVSSEQAGGMLISYFASQIGKAMSDDERHRLRRAVGLASSASSLDIGPEERCFPVRAWRPL
jgi:hypothetical protein